MTCDLVGDIPLTFVLPAALPVHWACPFQLTNMKHCVSEVFHEPVLVWLWSSKNKRISKLQKSQARKLKNRKVCFCSFCVFMDWRNSVLREWL